MHTGNTVERLGSVHSTHYYEDVPSFKSLIKFEESERTNFPSGSVLFSARCRHVDGGFKVAEYNSFRIEVKSVNEATGSNSVHL